MEIIYCDQKADRPGDSYRLIFLTTGWHIVANGYLCKVADAEEGRQIIATLHGDSTQEEPSIDKL